MNPTLVASLTGLGGLVVSAFIAYTTRKNQEVSGEVSMLGVYDKLVQTLQAEIARRDTRIAELEQELKDKGAKTP